MNVLEIDIYFSHVWDSTFILNNNINILICVLPKMLLLHEMIWNQS